jgi:O-antigen ligase
MELFKKNPLTGGGFSYYSYRGSTHNTFLSFLSETGILGFGMFLILIGLIFYRGFKNYKLSDDYIYKEFSIIFTSLFIMFTVTGLTQDTGFESEINLMFYAFVGVLPINQGKYKLEAYLPKSNA